MESYASYKILVSDDKDILEILPPIENPMQRSSKSSSFTSYSSSSNSPTPTNITINTTTTTCSSSTKQYESSSITTKVRQSMDSLSTSQVTNNSSGIGLNQSINIPIDIYPCLLSMVAYELYQRVVLNDRKKNGIEYKNVFDGRHAVVNR
ncbi:hypothetical protein BJ944DRAFT_239987 [Cunninghamella echinulata]|nr:hypothetical protein BJ944DRAFT_239987 [Cunninghamella echinulata]